MSTARLIELLKERLEHGEYLSHAAEFDALEQFIRAEAQDAFFTSAKFTQELTHG